MARPMTAPTVGRVNRRFMFLALILGALSAVLAYAAFSRSGDSTTSSGGDATVVVVREAIPAGTRLETGHLQVTEVSANGLGENPVTNVTAALGKTTKVPLTLGQPILLSNLVGTIAPANDAITYVVPAGMRVMNMSVDRVSLVGGLVLPGDHVDILWAPYDLGPTYVLFQNVEVTAIEQTIVDIQVPVAADATADAAATGEEGPGVEGPAAETEADRTRATDAVTQPDAATVSLLLTPVQADTLFCAELFAGSSGGALRFTLRSFGDGEPLNTNAPACPPPQLQELVGR